MNSSNSALESLTGLLVSMSLKISEEITLPVLEMADSWFRECL